MWWAIPPPATQAGREANSRTMPKMTFALLHQKPHGQLSVSPKTHVP